MSKSSRSIASDMAAVPAAVSIPNGESASRSCVYFVSSAMIANAGRCFRACSISSPTLEPAANTDALKRSGKWDMTSSVCVPMEPVEPRIAILCCMDWNVWFWGLMNCKNSEKYLFWHGFCTNI